MIVNLPKEFALCLDVDDGSGCQGVCYYRLFEHIRLLLYIVVKSDVRLFVHLQVSRGAGGERSRGQRDKESREAAEIRGNAPSPDIVIRRLRWTVLVYTCRFMEAKSERPRGLSMEGCLRDRERKKVLKELAFLTKGSPLYDQYMYRTIYEYMF